MKTKIKSMAVAMMIACGLFTITGCSGCKSTARTSYVASGATHITVRSALSGWNDYLGVKDREILTMTIENAEKERAKIAEQNEKVADAYEKYRAAQIALLTAAQEFSKIPASDPNAPAAADRLSAAVAASTATMGSVLALLTEFGIKTN